VVAVIVWGLFGAPNAAWHLNGPWRLIQQVVFFGSAAVVLFATGQRLLSIAFALVYVLNYTLISVWAQ
jgi:hypothetical protein